MKKKEGQKLNDIVKKVKKEDHIKSAAACEEHIVNDTHNNDVTLENVYEQYNTTIPPVGKSPREVMEYDALVKEFLDLKKEFIEYRDKTSFDIFALKFEANHVEYKGKYLIYTDNDGIVHITCDRINWMALKKGTSHKEAYLKYIGNDKN